VRGMKKDRKILREQSVVNFFTGWYVLSQPAYYGKIRRVHDRKGKGRLEKKTLLSWRPKAQKQEEKKILCVNGRFADRKPIRNDGDSGSRLRRAALKIGTLRGPAR